MSWKTLPDLKYTESDEWVRIEGDSVTIGITDYAQDQLNDVVFVELPRVGDKLQKGANFGVVESVKAASDLVMPVSGELLAVNDALAQKPDLANSDPFGGAWMIKVRLDNAGDLAALLDAAAYEKFCESRAH